MTSSPFMRRLIRRGAASFLSFTLRSPPSVPMSSSRVLGRLARPPDVCEALGEAPEAAVSLEPWEGK